MEMTHGYSLPPMKLRSTGISGMGWVSQPT